MQRSLYMSLNLHLVYRILLHLCIKFLQGSKLFLIYLTKIHSYNKNYTEIPLFLNFCIFTNKYLIKNSIKNLCHLHMTTIYSYQYFLISDFNHLHFINYTDNSYLQILKIYSYLSTHIYTYNTFLYT